MSNPMKEQIAADLEKAKVVGGSRAERIRKIFQDAFSQTLTELKGGTSEIGSIAKDSTSTLIGNLKENLNDKQSDVEQVTTVPVEVKIEDHDESVAESIIESTVIETPVTDVSDVTVEIHSAAEPMMAPSTDLDQPVQLVEQAPETPIETISVSSEEPAQNLSGSFSDSLKAMAERLLQSIQQGETYASVKQQLEALDAKLTARYGTRYEAFKQEFKQDMVKAKTWYENTKAENAASGTNWVEQKQADLEVKMGQTGATIAQKEQKIKQLLKELWLTVSKF
jgi:hypothetical protein